MIKSAFQTHFAQIPQVKRPRSQFKRVSRHKHTFDEGQLIPFYLDDVIPGDTFNLRASMFARLATPIFPIMDNMYLETFWFFVPNRLVWTNFVKQHGERMDPDDSTDYTTPVIDSTTIAANAAVGSLWDNYGLPMQGKQYLTKVSALPFRMYNLIWREWFRDQDLQDSPVVDLDDGPDSLADYQIKRIGKFKDYFTTARPEPQKGPDVELPLGSTAPVIGDNTNPIKLYGSNTGVLGTLQATTAADPSAVRIDGTAVFGAGEPLWAPGGQSAHPTVATGYLTDLTSATAATVNEWREAVTIQQMYEIDMRGGTRFIEMIFNHYGVINPDFRLQRPEFLGYNRSMVNIHPVPQQSETNVSGTPQGNLAAFGTVSSHGNGFVKSFTEFGYVIGLMAVRSDLSYQEGLDRHWSRRTRFDYYYPSFANLGEQAVLNQEIWTNPAAATNNEGVFGYQERWAEYRFKTSKITGLFRSTASGSLDAWHLAEEFASLPALDTTFIQENAPVDRCIAVSSEPHFIFDSLVENVTARVMPVYSAPGLTRI